MENLRHYGKRIRRHSKHEKQPARSGKTFGSCKKIHVRNNGKYFPSSAVSSGYAVFGNVE